MSELPLSGIRVLAFEQYGAGPFGSVYLADQGAEVIKIENPADGGDYARYLGPFFVEGDKNDSLFGQGLNRNKRSLTLNLKAPGAREVLHDLVRSSDAVFNNLRGDQPAKLGITYDALKAVNPKIVCAHLSAYGREGSRASWPGFDYLMQAEAGYLAVTGEPDGPPTRMGLSLVDLMTGLTAAFGLLAGVHRAQRTGVGGDIDTSLFDVALYNLNYLALWYLNAGHNQGREPRAGHPSLHPCGLFTTADGWIFLMCNKEKFWGVLARAVGHPEWAEDSRFATFADRNRNRAEVTRLLDEALSARTTADWLEAFAGEVPAAPVLDVAGALETPFVAERGRVADYAHPKGGSVRMLTPPLAASGAESPRRASPTLGADTEALLRGLGYDDARLAALRGAGVI